MDLLYSVKQRCLEEPIETAVLLSLVGVESIVNNQWPTLLKDNMLRATILWDSEWAPWLSQSLLGLLLKAFQGYLWPT